MVQLRSKGRLRGTRGKPFTEHSDPLPPTEEAENCGVLLEYSHPPFSGYPPITKA